jgi:hypothetical protein
MHCYTRAYFVYNRDADADGDRAISSPQHIISATYSGSGTGIRVRPYEPRGTVRQQVFTENLSVLSKASWQIALGPHMYAYMWVMAFGVVKYIL